MKKQIDIISALRKPEVVRFTVRQRSVMDSMDGLAEGSGCSAVGRRGGKSFMSSLKAVHHGGQ